MPPTTPAEPQLPSDEELVGPAKAFEEGLLSKEDMEDESVTLVLALNRD